MFIFLASMMVLVFVKNRNAYYKPVIYADDFESAPKEGVSPVVLGAAFFVVIVVIYLLAKSNFVNTTLVFTVVVCILLFIFMLKLTLFESRRRLVLNSGFRTPINIEHPID
jgi:UDP-N-acetylmuramyl pentapeptide phosphotransferase/UDP-N-acetylglucosamine-1-phosphate transferase